MKRVLVTGSRFWVDRKVVREALLFHGRGVLIQGEAKGLDTVAKDEARKLGFPIEGFHALWDVHGRGAGHRRNQQMVDAGADVCLAFPMPDSRGTYDCVARCRRAKIPVFWFTNYVTIDQIREGMKRAVEGL